MFQSFHYRMFVDKLFCRFPELFNYYVLCIMYVHVNILTILFLELIYFPVCLVLLAVISSLVVAYYKYKRGT